MKSEPPSPPLSPPIASTSNRPVTRTYNWWGWQWGLLLVLAIGGDSSGDGGSDFIVLELPRTGRAVCGRYHTPLRVIGRGQFDRYQFSYSDCHRCDRLLEEESSQPWLVAFYLQHERSKL